MVKNPFTLKTVYLVVFIEDQIDGLSNFFLCYKYPLVNIISAEREGYLEKNKICEQVENRFQGFAF